MPATSGHEGCGFLLSNTSVQRILSPVTPSEAHRNGRGRGLVVPVGDEDSKSRTYSQSWLLRLSIPPRSLRCLVGLRVPLLFCSDLELTVSLLLDRNTATLALPVCADSPPASSTGPQSPRSPEHLLVLAQGGFYGAGIPKFSPLQAAHPRPWSRLAWSYRQLLQ